MYTMKIAARQKALSKFYENLALSSEDSRYYISPTGIERRRKVISLLSPSKKDVICELGCGDGNLSANLDTKVKRMCGLDISHTRAKRAGKKRIDVVCADAASTPFTSESFDKIICSEVIEHVINPKDVLKEIKRLLKRNGCAVLTVPYNENLKRTLNDISEQDLAQMNYCELIQKYKIVDAHLHSFSEAQFINLLEEEGFRTRKIDYTHTYSPKHKGLVLPLTFMLRTIKRLKTNRVMAETILSFFYEKKDAKDHIIVRIVKP